ncbi:MAG: hypothetical protein V5A68_02880 [Candidatus Thermoplasmatota archaeon]
MLIVGLLSTKDEIREIKYIASICSIEKRVHFIVKMQKIRDLVNEKKEKE